MTEIRNPEGGIIILSEQSIQAIQEQLAMVSRNLNDVSLKLATMESTLAFRGTESMRIATILDQLETLLYGKGAHQPQHSIVTRMQALENSQISFKRGLWAIWSIIVALIINFINSHWGPN